MGHSTIAVTIDLYGTYVAQDEQARMDRDDAAFLAARPTAPVVRLRGG